MQKIIIDIDANHEATVFTVVVPTTNVPESVIREVADWAMSMETGTDMDSFSGSEWEIEGPDEFDGGWILTYNREA